MRKTLRVCHVGWLCAAVAACLSACGSGKSSGATAALIHRTPPKVVRMPAKPVDTTADMSTAVATMKGPAGVTLKFQLAGRPMPGQPLNVDFALVPDANVVSVSGRFEADDGLKLVNGDQMAAIDKPAANLPIRHRVTVIPSKDGIYTISVSLTVTVAGDDPRLHTFAIPIIAGEGLPQLAAHADPAPSRH